MGRDVIDLRPAGVWEPVVSFGFDSAPVSACLFATPYGPTPRKWQIFAGKLWSLDVHELKEAIPHSRNRFWSYSLYTPLKADFWEKHFHVE